MAQIAAVVTLGTCGGWRPLSASRGRSPTWSKTTEASFKIGRTKIEKPNESDWTVGTT